jgi:hypothetical protein
MDSIERIGESSEQVREPPSVGGARGFLPPNGPASSTRVDIVILVQRERAMQERQPPESLWKALGTLDVSPAKPVNDAPGKRRACQFLGGH